MKMMRVIRWQKRILAWNPFTEKRKMRKTDVNGNVKIAVWQKFRMVKVEVTSILNKLGKNK